MKKETIKRAAAVTLAALMAGSALAGCGGNASSNTDSKGDSKAESSKTESKADATGGKVYYLNFKPEQDQAWQDLAKKYTEETGTEVTVVTAAEGTYEQTLTSEMAKGDEAPTLFQVNGPVGLAKWEDFCKDLTRHFSTSISSLTSLPLRRSTTSTALTSSRLLLRKSRRTLRLSA